LSEAHYLGARLVLTPKFNWMKCMGEQKCTRCKYIQYSMNTPFSIPIEVFHYKVSKQINNGFTEITLN
jgi:hypothetical protein